MFQKLTAGFVSILFLFTTFINPSSVFASGLTIDTNVSFDQSSPAKTIKSPVFSTSAPNEIIYAFITSDGPSNNTIRFSSVTGGGLTWTLIKRVNTQRGTSEIWKAKATTIINDAQVTATRSSGSYMGSITVLSFVGADLNVNGATGGANARTGAPSASLTTTKDNSWVFGVGNDWDNAITRTIGPNQTMIHQYLAPIGDTFWVQRQDITTPTAGTQVTINDTAPTTDRWNLAIVEILPADTIPTHTPTPTPIPPTNTPTPIPPTATPTPIPAVSIWSDSIVPANPEVVDANPVSLGVKFRSDVPGQITGIRFYKGTNNTGTHTGSLWTENGTRLATATFTNETASGWQQVGFDIPVTIEANSTYVASYFAPNGNYAGDNNYFTTTFDNTPLHALANDSSNGNGIYIYGGDIFPVNSYQASNYWVDVVFNPSQPNPTATPTTFDPPVTPSPSPTSGPTPTPAVGEATLWKDSDVPGTPVTDDSSSVSLGVKFKSDSSGKIKGIRFYKGTGNTGTHTGSLWTSDGARLATVTFTNETETGWQNAYFSTPVEILPNTIYVASYFAPNGKYASDSNYFTNKHDRAPLHALANGMSEGNGVYTYGSDAFPTSSIGSSNYWVDVIFEPTTLGSLDLAKVDWEGGPSYYAQFPDIAQTEWTTENFFPIGYWGGYMDAQSKLLQDKNVGINTLFAYFAAAENSAQWVRDAGIWNMAGAFASGNGSEHVGYIITDEADMWGGSGWEPWTGTSGFVPNVCIPDDPRHCGYTAMDTLEDALPDDNKVRYVNYGKGALMWQSFANASVFYTGGNNNGTWNQHMVTGDIYFYTDGNTDFEAPNWYGVPADQGRRAANYGEILMHKQRLMSGYQNNGVPRTPLGVVVELGGQTTGRIITPDQIEGAVWSSLIHEARIVNYFSHAFSDTPENPWSSDVLNDPNYTAVQNKVKTTNDQIIQLAPVLNTQSLAWTFNNSLSTMLKEKNGTYYVFAMQERQFNNGTYTFTLPSGMTTIGNVEVLFENRTVPVENGTFTDTFEAEYSHHIYKITP